MMPISSIQHYLMLRSEYKHVAMFASARFGHSDDKRRLLQFNYSCIPAEDKYNAAIESITASLDKAKADIATPESEIVELERKLVEARAEYEDFKTHALDTDRYKEQRSVSDLAVRTAQYCLDVQDMLWSKRLRSEQLASYEGIDLSHAGAGRPNETLDMLDRLPGKFTTAEACQTLQDKSKHAVQCIIRRLMKANLIRKGGMLGKTAYYIKA